MSKPRNLKSKDLPIGINRLAVVLKEERRSNRWLALEIGFTETTISKWANNAKQPNIFIFYMIALALRRNLQDLFFSTKDISEMDRTEHLKILAKIVEKGKRTGKTKR